MPLVSLARSATAAQLAALQAVLGRLCGVKNVELAPLTPSLLAALQEADKALQPTRPLVAIKY